jgi:hypothetical protein
MSTNSVYWDHVYAKSASLKSDGCSYVSEAFHQCCLEHDIHYRTGTRVDGKPITRAQADKRFRECMQMRSRFGKLSPMAWWRWAGVRIFGRFAK